MLTKDAYLLEIYTYQRFMPMRDACLREMSKGSDPVVSTEEGSVYMGVQGGEAEHEPQHKTLPEQQAYERACLPPKQ